MKKLFYMVSTFIAVSCGNRSDNDGSGGGDGFSQNALPPVVSTWLSECIRSSSGSFYLEREYVFYQGEFYLNIAAYEDANCFEYLGGTDGFDTIVEYIYDDYTIATSESGYEVTWFHSYIRDALNPSITYELEAGFYFDGDTMYRVSKNADIYSIDFMDSYNLQL